MTILRLDNTIGQSPPVVCDVLRLKRANDIRTFNISVFEVKQDLITFLWFERHTATISGKGCRHTDPRRTITILELPGESHTDASKFVRVEIVLYKGHLRIRCPDIRNLRHQWRTWDGCTKFIVLYFLIERRNSLYNMVLTIQFHLYDHIVVVIHLNDIS